MTGRKMLPHGSACTRAHRLVSHVVRAASWLLVAGGLSALAFVNIADWHAQWVAEQHISHMQQICADTLDSTCVETKKQAIRYNARIAGTSGGDGLWPYHRQLLYREEPMMSYLEIPKISLRLPIYHGVEENALMAGIGHWEQSSLPVGGPSSHCVLLGHSGMRNTRMFDDIRRLEIGDKLVIWTLGEPHAYEVIGKRTVLPRDVGDFIAIEPECDLVTLITCTPYGVNSHRLLVHTRRCAYTPDEIRDVGIDAYVNERNLPLIASMALLAAFALKTALSRKQKHLANGQHRRNGNA